MAAQLTTLLNSRCQDSGSETGPCSQALLDQSRHLHSLRVITDQDVTSVLDRMEQSQILEPPVGMAEVRVRQGRMPGTADFDSRSCSLKKGNDVFLKLSGANSRVGWHPSKADIGPRLSHNIQP